MRPPNPGYYAFPALLSLLGSACRSPSPKFMEAAGAASSAGQTVWIGANGQRLKTKIYRSARFSDHPILVVILHGDSPGGPTSYQYEFARTAAEHIDNIVAAAVLRPGYRDDTGDRSEGHRGMAIGDNYTPGVVDAVARATAHLRSELHPSATVVMGHSGGASITASLIGRASAGIDGALLVSCPCDVPAWRQHMVSALFRTAGPFSLLFLLPVNSLSPLALASGVPVSMCVRMVVGSEDNNTLPKFTQEYADALRKRGIDVGVTVAPGLEHDILQEPVVYAQLKSLVGELARKSAVHGSAYTK